MKSMCHDSRRNSPSVIERRPVASWRRMTSTIASSSIARRSSGEMRPLALSSRACSTSGGRSRLPTWSARKGGVVRTDIRRSLGSRVWSRRSYKFVDNPVDRMNAHVIDDDGYQALRAAIVSGELLPSERLVEEDLARRLGLGRAAVRMALVRLEHDGLVERERNRGARVRRGAGAEAGGILPGGAAPGSPAGRQAAARGAPEGGPGPRATPP